MFSGERKVKLARRGGFAWAMLMGFAFTALLLAVTALLLSAGKIGYSAAAEIVTGINFAGAALAGALAAKSRGKGAVQNGLIAGAVFLAVLLLAGLAFSGGSLSGRESIRIAICSICGGLFGGVLSIGAGNKKLHKKHGPKK